MASSNTAPGTLTLPEIEEALADYSARAASARNRDDATDLRLCHRVIDDLIGQRAELLERVP